MQWLLSSAYVIKLNVDVSYNQSSQVVGLGIVARNDQREVCLSAVAKVTNVRNPLQAEVMAILFGVKLMYEYDWLNIIVESDCKIVISLINGDISNYQEDGGVQIDDIIRYVEMFESISFNFIRREANHLC